MMRSFISDILVRKTAVLFSDTLLGRALLQKAIALVSKESGLPLQVQPEAAGGAFWLIDVGEPGADLCLHIRVQRETLVELVEYAANAWLEGRKVTARDVLPLLARYTHARGQ